MRGSLYRSGKRQTLDPDARKYVDAVNAASTTPLEREAISEIDGLVKFLKGKPSRWANENSLTPLSASYWDNIDFALLHTEAGNTDSGAGSNLQPLRGRQWVEPGSSSASGDWVNSSSRPFSNSFTADGNDGFTATDSETSQEDRCAVLIGSVTSGEQLRYSFDYDTTGSGGSTDWRIELRNGVDSTPAQFGLTFASGATSGTIEGTMTPSNTDSSMWFAITQFRAAQGPSNIVVSNFKIWTDWESSWVAEAQTAPTHDGVKGGHYVLTDGAPRDGAYDGLNDVGIARIDGLSFTDCFFAYVGTTVFDASHVAIMAMGADSSIDAQNDPDGFLVKRDGAGSSIVLLRSTNITTATHTRSTADEAVTDVQVFINNDSSAGLRHEGSTGTNDTSPGNVTMNPEFITVGGRYLSSSIQNEQPLAPYGVAIMGTVPSEADGDAISAAFEACVTNLKAL